jgi:predicted nucleic acid-binding protein
MARHRAQAPPAHLILDSGAVIALSRQDVRARAALAAAVEAGAEVSIPAVVLAETVRGRATDAPVHRVLTAVDRVEVVDERIGRRAGDLLGHARATATIDAIVVATAIEVGGAAILTGDPSDLRVFAAGHPTVVIHAL